MLYREKIAASSDSRIKHKHALNGKDEEYLTFRRRIKSRLPFAGIIRRLPYSTRFQDKG